MDSLTAARKYRLERGWAPIPVPAASKNPGRKGWQNERCDEATLPERFGNGENVGVLLGEPSGGLVDVDCDCAEAIAASDRFLPPTRAIFGRRSAPGAHRIYRAPDLATERFLDVRDGNGKTSSILEVRGTGCQTIFPPSMHPSDERIRWERFGEPTEVAAEELTRLAGVAASAALLARHWPKEPGARQELALAIGGFILRRGMDPALATEMVGAAAEIAGDEEFAKRAQAVRDTAENLGKKNLTGHPTVVVILGEERAQAVAHRLEEWLGLRDGCSPGVPITEHDQPDVFPLEVLPERIRRVVEIGTTSINCPVDFLGVFLLVFTGVAIGTTRVLEIKPGWTEAPRFYTAVVADPGNKKSPAMKVASGPLDRRQSKLVDQFERETEEYREEVARHEIREAEWRRSLKSGEAEPQDKPEPPEEPTLLQVYTTDSTVEALAELIERNPRGILLLRDELTAWVLSFNQYKGGKGADRQAFLSFWSGGTVVVNRKHRKNPVVLPDPFVCVVGCLPPDVLSDLSDERGREDGFIHRVLFSFPGRVEGKWVDEGIPETVLEELNQVFDRLWSLEPWRDAEGKERPVKVPFTPRAKGLWVQWITEHYEEQGERDFPVSLRGPWAKLDGYCARLALVVHFLRLACGEIDSEPVDEVSVASAWALVDYFKSHARRVYQRLRTTPEDQRAQRALVWISRQPEKNGRVRVSARDILTNHVAGVKTASEAKALLKNLDDRGFGVTDEASKNRFVFTLHRPAQQAADDEESET